MKTKQDKVNSETVSKHSLTYEDLFDDDTSKAAAFDRIAQEYYKRNFGTFSKSEMDLLMFSIILDRLYEKEKNLEAKDFYGLSRMLGITPSRVNSFREKKELKYETPEYDWKKVFCECLKKATLDSEQKHIRVFIPDKDVVSQVKSHIEMAGGFTEVQLNTNVLQVEPKYLIDLLISLDGPLTADKKKEILDKVKKNSEDEAAVTEKMLQLPLGEAVGKEMYESLLEALNGLGFWGGAAASFIETATMIFNRINEKEK